MISRSPSRLRRRSGISRRPSAVTGTLCVRAHDKFMPYVKKDVTCSCCCFCRLFILHAEPEAFSPSHMLPSPIAEA